MEKNNQPINIAIIGLGGQGVIPQSRIFSIKKASAVLNIEPTLLALLTLSKETSVST